MKNFIENIQYKVDCMLEMLDSKISLKAQKVMIFTFLGAAFSIFIYFIANSAHYRREQAEKIELLRQKEIDNQQSKQENSNILNFENYKYE